MSNITVTPLVGQYAVRNGQLFYVQKTRSCSCGEPDCLHVQAVMNYLRNGGICAPVAVTPMVSCVRVEWSADNVHFVREDVARDASARIVRPGCSCGRANCAAIYFAARICPVCGAARTDREFCSTDPTHYHAHWIARLQVAHNHWHNRLLQNSYYREVVFQDEAERCAFLEAHKLTYSAGG